MQLQSKVKILELILDRHHFTSHGLHLNFKGKKVVSQNLALIIKQFFNKENKPPIAIPIPISIPTPWKDLPLYTTNTEFQDTIKTNES